MGNYSFHDLAVGMISRKGYQFTAKRINAFSELVDDAAPVHTNPEFAKQLGFDNTIAHGLFVQSVISGMLGTDIPGPQSVINSLTMNMHLPVLAGQQVDYHIEITSLTAAVSAVSLKYSGTANGKLVISGKALCSFPKHISD